jgi:hypothetical protein
MSLSPEVAHLGQCIPSDTVRVDGQRDQVHVGQDIQLQMARAAFFQGYHQRPAGECRINLHQGQEVIKVLLKGVLLLGCAWE